MNDEVNLRERPFLLDIRDLDAYVEKHKHHGTDDPIFRPLPVHEPSTSSKLKGDDYAASSGNRKPVSAERQRGLVDQIPSQRKIVSWINPNDGQTCSQSHPRKAPGRNHYEHLCRTRT